MKKKALKVSQKEKTAAAVKAYEKSTKDTDHNRQVLEDVWTGQRQRKALTYEDQGGDLKRVGWPDGYKKELDAAVQAHEKLFARRPPASKRAKGDAPRSTGSFKPDAKVHLLAKENPKKPGSNAHRAWLLYREGMTVKEYLDAGGKVGDLKWDTSHGFIEVT
jgi:hypothetical protein